MRRFLHGSAFRLVAPILLVAAVVLVLLRPMDVGAQRPAPAVAQVGVGSPLPVFVVNEQQPALPSGFAPGTSWKFTTWTMPSTLTFTASVEKVEGGWAYLKVTNDAPTAARWYYVPQMPGAWELVQ